MSCNFVDVLGLAKLLQKTTFGQVLCAARPWGACFATRRECVLDNWNWNLHWFNTATEPLRKRKHWAQQTYPAVHPNLGQQILLLISSAGQNPSLCGLFWPTSPLYQIETLYPLAYPDPHPLLIYLIWDIFEHARSCRSRNSDFHVLRNQSLFSMYVCPHAEADLCHSLQISSSVCIQCWRLTAALGPGFFSEWVIHLRPETMERRWTRRCIRE